MKPKRSKVDWALEMVALLAVAAAVWLVLSEWDQIPVFGLQRGGRFGMNRGPWTARNALWVVTLLNVGAYLGLTAATHWQKLIHIPADMDRDAPHVRQLLFSMVIVLKAVLMLFSLYVVWALVNVALGQGGGLSPKFLTVFTLAVPLPLILYTVKLRRYRK